MCFGQRAAKRAAEEAARQQVAALERAAIAEADQKKQAALSAVNQIQQQTARQAAETSAAEVLTAPLDTAEVLLEGAAPEASSVKRKKRDTAYGSEYSSGVSI